MRHVDGVFRIIDLGPSKCSPYCTQGNGPMGQPLSNSQIVLLLMIYLQITDEEDSDEGQEMSKVIFLGTQLPKKGQKCFAPLASKIG